eukprot:TRINITY_DN435_c0_g1_i10.p1 TRINITY_DN435_c0_g1~~TRINITY_DN435_c0_g1_i10.p1  ORF type:complete len:637 (-),score=114.68 TRINITY_DN435_c0_g1_i10:159-2069(-)
MTCKTHVLFLLGLAVRQIASEEAETLPEVSLLQAHVNMMAEVDEHGHVSAGVAGKRVRVKLAVEQDLSKLSKAHFRAWYPDEPCHTNAKNAFDQVMNTNAELKDQFNDTELANFKARFVEDLDLDCKNDELASEHWEELVRAAIENDKPAITQALAQSINDSGAGYTVTVQSWMANQTIQDLERKEGLVLPSAEELLLELDTTTLLEEDTTTPSSFDSRDKIPACRDVVGKIHNQGTCGSCWAFGAMSAIDSRLCIASRGAFSGDRAIISRGYVTSCSKPGSGGGPGDGCQGGWFTYVSAILKSGTNGFSAGVPTGGPQGCSPYFGQGAGEDHFHDSGQAPPCPTQCGNSNYFRSMAQDKYIMSSLTGRTLTGASNSNNHAQARRAIYEAGPIGAAMRVAGGFNGYSSGVFSGCASSPNHAVTAIGYGPDYFDCLNSWGENWGNNGGFRGADCVFTHWWIPENLPTTVNPELPGSGPASPTPAPTPAPPTSFSSWSVQTGSCTVDESGCVMSTSFDGSSSQYPGNDRCTINVGGNSPAIEVVEFDTESNWDKLIVNGRDYSGGASDLHGVVPTGPIEWRSNCCRNRLGWKLCPRRPEPSPSPPPSQDDVMPSDAERVGGFTDADGNPYGIYVHDRE